MLKELGTPRISQFCSQALALWRLWKGNGSAVRPTKPQPCRSCLWVPGQITERLQVCDLYLRQGSYYMDQTGAYHATDDLKSLLAFHLIDFQMHHKCIPQRAHPPWKATVAQLRGHC